MAGFVKMGKTCEHENKIPVWVNREVFVKNIYKKKNTTIKTGGKLLNLIVCYENIPVIESHLKYTCWIKCLAKF